MISKPGSQPAGIIDPDILPQYQVKIRPGRGWVDFQLKAVWQYRELLYFLVWRDVKIRYKQTLLGIGWILLQPLISMLIFSGIFGVLLNAPSGGVPYPLFVLTGLLPWQYFAGSLAKASSSLIDSSNLITKVYFPRLIIPLSAVFSGLVDFAVSFIMLLAVMFYYQFAPSYTILWLPALLLLAMITALGFGLWLSAFNVRYRDVKYLVPFLVQAWMYLTPVAYGSTLIPERYRWIMGLNPMTGVVEGFRWVLLGSKLENAQPSQLIFMISIALTFTVLLTGIAFFRHTERTFADII